ncbi:hypothetical protein TNCV_4287541 [Trichonephila clavipes]|uniref:Uncharacterized protein n=1 Tax=Trichonephila clavipes TaxID=2585209 RepID=A0A8X6SIY3_TRICX|nr:hypothetical protein TNCV_4287541 [Trichonephila clavipes]
MLPKYQTIKMTTSCDVWMMTKSEVSIAAIVDCNRYHMPQHRIQRFWMHPWCIAVHAAEPQIDLLLQWVM